MKSRIWEETEKYSKEVEEKLKQLSKEEIEGANDEIINEAKKQYDEFVNAFNKGECYICNYSIDYFNENEPCLHWLLKPSEFKKKHFKLIYKKFSYSQIDPYLRWMANYESPFKNINDLSEEKSESKVIETTIKYKNIEWSFSCSKNDLVGHDTNYSNFPHYHFQMRVDNLPFINYSDFHIPLNSYDLFIIKIKKSEIKNIIYLERFGAGMEEASKINPELLLEGMKNTKNNSEGTFHLQTVITAKNSKTISGDDIADLIKESQKTSVPLAKLSKRLKGVKRITIISPGEGVPNIAKRSPIRKRKRAIRNI